MSKFIRRLEQLGEGTSKPLGFGANNRQGIPPTMGLILSVDPSFKERAAISTVVDACIFSEAGRTKKTKTKNRTKSDPAISGLTVNQTGSTEVPGLLSRGYDFAVFESQEISVSALEDESLGRILTIDSTLTKESARALSALPLDAVLLQTKVASPLKINDLIRLASIRGEIAKLFLLTVSLQITGWEIECLREIGVDGLVVHVDSSVSEEDITKLADQIKSLPRRKNRGDKPTATLPQLASQAHIHEADDDGDEEMDFRNDIS